MRRRSSRRASASSIARCSGSSSATASPRSTTEGAFDPHVHEALLAQPGEGAEEGSVLQVLQKGYRLGDKVIRPARVIVAE